VPNPQGGKHAPLWGPAAGPVARLRSHAEMSHGVILASPIAQRWRIRRGHSAPRHNLRRVTSPLQSIPPSDLGGSRL